MGKGRTGCGVSALGPSSDTDVTSPVGIALGLAALVTDSVAVVATLGASSTVSLVASCSASG